MARRTRIAALLGTGALLIAAPVHAGSTDATFEVSGSETLYISVPNSGVDFGQGAAGASVGGALGDVTVTDERSNLLATWTAQVNATDFLLVDEAIDGEHPDEAVVTTDDITYDPGTVALVLGSVTGDGLNAGTPGAIGEGRIAATFVGIGNNEVSWNPDVTFDLDASQVRGVYEGTITHSVTADLLD